MSNRGGKPHHAFAEFVTPVRQIMVNKSNCLAVCNGCISKKGFSWAKIHCNEEKNKVSNTIPSIGKHIMECQHFKEVFPDKYQQVKEHLEQLKQQRKASVEKRARELNQGNIHSLFSKLIY